MASEEFRIVVNEEDIRDLDFANSIDFTDYYLSRNTRVRFNLRGYPHGKKELENKIFLITSKPGTINKEMRELSKSEAEESITNAIIIIEKKGIGVTRINGVEGYAERVIAYRFNKGKQDKILDEIHIEFEDDISKLDKISRVIKPIKIIDMGLFDYISTF